jgi:hypothetical protein
MSVKSSLLAVCLVAAAACAAGFAPTGASLFARSSGLNGASSPATRRASPLTSLFMSDDLRTQLIGAKKAVSELIDKTNANPILVRRCHVLNQPANQA